MGIGEHESVNEGDVCYSISVPGSIASVVGTPRAVLHRLEVRPLRSSGRRTDPSLMMWEPLTALDKPYGFHVEIEIDPHVDIDRQSPYRRRLVVVRIDAYVSTPRLGGLEAWTSVSIVHRSPSGFDVELVEPFSRQGDKSHYQRLHDALQRWDATQERWRREMNS